MHRGWEDGSAGKALLGTIMRLEFRLPESIELLGGYGDHLKSQCPAGRDGVPEQADSQSSQISEL